MTNVWTSSTGRGRAVFVLAVALLWSGLAWHYPLVAGLGGCLLALVVAELVSVLGTRAVEVQREVDPPVVLRHGHCRGRLRVIGRRRRGLSRIDVADRVDGALVTVHLPDRASDGNPSTDIDYEIPTPRRGLVDVGPTQVRLAGLTGMAARSTDVGGIDQVRVLPRRIPLGAMMRGHRRSAAGGDDSIELGGTDLVGLHEYQMGDDLRRLHWATSARTGTLMVREDAEPSEPHLCVLLDDRGDSYGQGAELFEEAVELAAALCTVGAQAGHPVRLQTASGRSEVVVPGSVSRRPRREQQELDWLLAEIDLTASGNPIELSGRRDLDIAVAITGAHADLRELGLALGNAAVQVIAVSDPAPLVAVQQDAGQLVLRAATSTSLAMLWDGAAQR